MKKRLLCMALILVVGLAVAACGAPPDAIQWQEPALEALVREKLDKPKGAITPADLEHIWGIELFGESHIFFNAEGGFIMYTSPDGEGMLDNPDNIEISGSGGTYSVQREPYKRGSISSLADFAYFPNLKYLYVYKNDLVDLAGASALSAMEQLTELRVVECEVRDLTALAQLPQVKDILLNYNQIEDLTPLVGLSQGQLRKLNVRDNQIHSLAGVEALRNLKILNLGNNRLIDSLEALPGLALESLYVDGTAVDDLSPLSGMISLQVLGISNIKTANVDLAPLAALENLTTLHLSQERAKLLNIQVVEGFGKLSYLEITMMQLSSKEMDWLKNALPQCYFAWR